MKKGFGILTLALLIGFLGFALNSHAQSNCIDLTNLDAPYIHCTYGYYGNPFANQGRTPNRHVVITQQGTDANTRDELTLIPPDENYSIRLGDLRNGGNAESISVDITVDTNNFDLLILKYAAVMQDPNHSQADQPRFTFAILDTQDNEIDPNCLSEDFIANPNLGWNSLNGGQLLWKDWTNVGVDISEYHGQTIRVRLVTYDCAFTAHFGYAYFLLSCGHKHIKIDVCGDMSFYTYSAPSGFNYRWYWQDDPSQTLSSEQTVQVPAGGNRVLKCHVSFVGNDNCGFDLSTTTEYRYPLSGFSIEETNCPQVFHFINQSAISNDGVNPDGTGNLCENTRWLFGDGKTSTEINPTHKYELPGDYTVKMVAGLNNFECTDTTSQVVHIPENTLLDTVVCDAFEWIGNTYTTDGEYSHNFVTEGGCDSLVTVRLSIVHSDETTVDTLGCDQYQWNDSIYYYTGSYTQQFFNVNRCDSVVTTNLDMNYTPYFNIQGDHWPIGGTEWAYTKYPYKIILNQPLCQVDSISWSVDNENMSIRPIEDGMKAELRIYTYLDPNDSVAIHAVLYNRCGEIADTIWIHTTYYDVDEHDGTIRAVKVYPNPTPGLFNLEMRGMEGRAVITMYDSQGVVVKKWEEENLTDEMVLPVDCTQLHNGIYTIQVQNDTATLTKRIVVSK